MGDIYILEPAVDPTTLTGLNRILNGSVLVLRITHLGGGAWNVHGMYTQSAGN